MEGDVPAGGKKGKKRGAEGDDAAGPAEHKPRRGRSGAAADTELEAPQSAAAAPAVAPAKLGVLKAAGLAADVEEQAALAEAIRMSLEAPSLTPAATANEAPPAKKPRGGIATAVAAVASVASALTASLGGLGETKVRLTAAEAARKRAETAAAAARSARAAACVAAAAGPSAGPSSAAAAGGGAAGSGRGSPGGAAAAAAATLDDEDDDDIFQKPPSRPSAPLAKPRGGSAAGASARGGAAARAVDDEDEEDEDEGAGAGATGGTAANGGAARGAGGRMDKEGRRQMQAEVARSRAAHFALGGASAIEERAGARAAPAPARRRSAAAAAAAAAAPSPQDLGDDGEPKEMWPGMFTTAWDLESKRGAAAELRKEKLREAALAGPVEELVPWTPQRTGPRRKPAWEVPRLADLVVQMLVENIEGVETLDGFPDVGRRQISARLGELRKLTPEVARLFTKGSPGEAALADCTLIPEEDLTEAVLEAVTPKLQILDLGLCGRGMTDKVLFKAFEDPLRASGLQALAIRGAYRLTDAGIAAAAKAAPGIVSLEVTHSARITSDAAKAVAEACGNKLRSLSLDFCTAVAGPALVPVVSRCAATLQRLSLAGITDLDDASIQEIAVDLGQTLRELRLSDCTSLTDASLIAVSAMCPLLRTLEVDRIDGITDVGVAAVAEGCKQLSTFSAKRCDGLEGSEPIEAIARATGTSLRFLHVSKHKGITDQTLLVIAESCPELQEIDLSFCRGVTDNGLGRLADACAKLRRVHVWGCRKVTDKFISGTINEGLQVLGHE